MALAMGPAFAVTVPDLYEVSVPMTGGRDAAFVEALKTVVVRVSGRRDAAVRIGGALNDPRKYVQRFGETADNQLQVGFDSVSVDGLLIDAGLPVWGRERPATLVLLNVQATDGSSYWIDGNASTVEREIINRAARERGLPIVWPASRIDVGSDASADTLMQAAASHNANAALLGNARSDGAGGLSVSWTLACAFRWRSFRRCVPPGRRANRWLSTFQRTIVLKAGQTSTMQLLWPVRCARPAATCW